MIDLCVDGREAGGKGCAGRLVNWLDLGSSCEAELWAVI